MTTHTHPLMARDLTAAAWFKSSYSGNGQNCAEVADLAKTAYGGVAIRDSKAPDGPALLVASDGWGAFIAAVKRGELPTT